MMKKVYIKVLCLKGRVIAEEVSRAEFERILHCYCDCSHVQWYSIDVYYSVWLCGNMQDTILIERCYDE